MITTKNKIPIVSDYIPSIEPATATVEEMDDWIVAIGGKVEGVSKKFCRSLKKSLWYGETTKSAVAGNE